MSMLKRLKQQIKKYPRIVDRLRDLYAEIPYRLNSTRALPPLSVVLNLTYRCNMRCTMCYHHREAIWSKTNATLKNTKADELTTDEWKAFIDDIAAMGVQSLAFHGGEPMLRKDFVELSAYAHEKGLFTCAISNGTFLSDERLEAVVTNIDDLGVSLFGPEAVHDRCTGIPGSYRKLIAGIENLNRIAKDRNRKPLVSIYILISSMNQAYLEDAFDIALNLGVGKIGFGNLVFTNQKALEVTKNQFGIQEPSRFIGDIVLPDDLMEVDAELIDQQLKRIAKRSKELGIPTNLTGLNDAQKIMEYHTNIAFSLSDKCKYPWSISVLSPYGEVYPCIPFSFLDTRMGSIREKSFRQIWNDTPYREFRRKLKHNGLFPICTKCCQIRD